MNTNQHSISKSTPYEMMLSVINNMGMEGAIDGGDETKTTPTASNEATSIVISEAVTSSQSAAGIQSIIQSSGHSSIQTSSQGSNQASSQRKAFKRTKDSRSDSESTICEEDLSLNDTIDTIDDSSDVTSTNTNTKTTPTASNEIFCSYTQSSYISSDSSWKYTYFLSRILFQLM